MSASSARLAALSKELLHQWHQTREYWNDAQSADFERRFLQDLFATVDRSLGSMEQLDKLVARIKKDCE